MRVKNVSGSDRVIAATGQHVPVGDVVEVGDELGRSLCDQPGNWQQAEPDLFDEVPDVEGDE